VPAVLTLSFDPVLRLGETASIRIETAVLAAVLFCGLVLAVRMGKVGPAPGLRIDDLVFMVVGAVPGAIVGGRTGYVLDHLAFYQANPSLITDPAQGGFTLTLAVPLGMLSGAVIGRLLGAPIGRWMHALALPLLFVLGAGKLAGVLGGTGQGMPADAAWATAYIGPGPWGSLAADLPSHPSQVYEAALVGLGMLAYWPLSRLQLIRRETGAAMWAAVALWCVVRFAVGFTWRDPAVFGGLGAEQLLALGVGVLAIGGFLEQARRGALMATALPEAAPADAAAPAPETPAPERSESEASGDGALAPEVADSPAREADARDADPDTPKPNAGAPEPTAAPRRSSRRARRRSS